VLLDLLVVWGVVSWLGLYWHPGRPIAQGMIIGLVAVLLMSVAELGHPVAHILSARLAHAPMDEILISEGMARTLYANNDVPPSAHRLRAAGGPAFNALGLALSAAVYRVAPPGSIVGELAAWSAFGHGLLFVLSLVPLPMVDGGSLLKWTLVGQGRTPGDADAIIRRVDLALGFLGLLLGLALLALRDWVAGACLLGAGIIILGIAKGALR
jgi:hypothetical protein